MSVCKLDGRSSTWIFCTPQEKWKQECIEPVSNGSQMGVMFWGCFVGRHQGGFTALMPDEERTGKKGITGEIILDAYKEHLPKLFNCHFDRVFMHDNARVHTCHLVMDWLDEKGYSVMTWPPYSPDLNPIEMVWHKIKTWVYAHHPELRRMTAGNPKVLEAISEAVIEAWKALDGDFLASLVKSIPQRVQAVIYANGGYTKH